MWTTFSVMVVISMAVRQIIMDFMLKELEKKLADLEEKVQSQPLEIIGALSALRHKEMTKAGSSSPWKKHASDTRQTISGQELEYLRKQSTNAVIDR